MTSGALSIKLAWITDPHLDHLEKKDPGALTRLGTALDREGVSSVLLGGDIADSRSFEKGLRRLVDVCGRPLYYVLGNHDYYFSSVADVRGRAAALEIPGVQWLPKAGVVDLGGESALIGHGGWGDAHCGDLEDFIILTDETAAARGGSCRNSTSPSVGGPGILPTDSGTHTHYAVQGNMHLQGQTRIGRGFSRIPMGHDGWNPERRCSIAPGYRASRIKRSHSPGQLGTDYSEYQGLVGPGGLRRDPIPDNRA